ncbi:hypothetical protein [Sphingobacterium yanglingense]|uniref:Uncharacterized protein n=1 Tax=Sphingobacterium yanglingense TaxID=1437280 RepID=A0A4R6WAK6_9SPHI|nr:hypothetical protein [Sphingobacterium yanglingense]TDQ73915.1 hypothetical protein CLV99_4353 [Sphingobacterium yanglingense]
MKTNLFLASLALIFGVSCQQPTSENNNPAQEISNVDLSQQDSVLAVSINENSAPELGASPGFSTSFLSFLEKTPNSINFDFPKLVDAGMEIATSSDGVVRVYSWDNNQGGSMRFFNSIFQVSLPTGNQSISYNSTEEDRVFYPFYTRIDPIQLDGQVYYIAFARSVLSNKEVNHAVEIYKIEDNQLKPVDLFRIDNRLDYKLGKTFNYEELDEFDEELIRFDARDLTFTLPEVMQDGTFGKDTIAFQFKNSYFQKK